MASSNKQDAVRSRVDASGARLTSLRASSAAAEATGGAARRPKFVPKAAKRRSAGDAAQPTQPADEGAKTGANKPLRGDFPRGDRVRGGRGGEGGRGSRGGRGGRGRGRGNLPSGKVAFVGTLSGGSSYSAAAAPTAPRAAPSYAAADGLGISVLDDEDRERLPGDMNADVEMEEQWPPVVKSVMEPMSLPLARQPEPRHTGEVFCDENGQVVLRDDSLLFLQFPTTLPLANATVVSTASKDGEDDKMDGGNSASRSEDTSSGDKQQTEDSVKFDKSERFDGSITTAPGGFIGKLCIHKSGKTVLMIGDKRFDVATAQTPSVCEDVYSINAEEQQLFVLGSVERHLVVTPDFDALLA